jgi:hypothetical protein
MFLVILIDDRRKDEVTHRNDEEHPHIDRTTIEKLTSSVDRTTSPPPPTACRLQPAALPCQQNKKLVQA